MTGHRLPGSVLIVDDHVTAIRMLRRAIEHFGLYVISAESALEALELTGDNRWDVVVTDYMMPAMNGLELIEKLGDRAATWMMVTAYDSDGLQAVARRLGCAEYLIKPVWPEKFAAAVARCLARAETAARLAAIAPKEIEP